MERNVRCLRLLQLAERNGTERNGMEWNVRCLRLLQLAERNGTEWNGMEWNVRCLRLLQLARTEADGLKRLEGLALPPAASASLLEARAAVVSSSDDVWRILRSLPARMRPHLGGVTGSYVCAPPPRPRCSSSPSREDV